MRSKPVDAVRLSELKAGSKAAVARALTAVEEQGRSDDVLALLDEAFANPRAHVVGVTGPPGAGKSTLIDALLRHWRATALTVAVLAVDPSSKTSRGALLGDRVRMRTDPGDEGVFVRSLAARGRLGGLSDIAYPAAVLMRALYDRVIVESVGVGQSETDIATVADSVVLCIQPGSGDALQFMKAGILEIPDIAVVTKADMGGAASRALADLKGALQLAGRDDAAWEPACLAVSAANRDGLAELAAALASHWAWLAQDSRCAATRARQARHWAEGEIEARFGREGLALAAPLLMGLTGAPFRPAGEISRRIKVSLAP